MSVRGPVPDLGDLAERVTTLGGEVRIESVADGCKMLLVLPDFEAEPEVPRDSRESPSAAQT